MADAKLTALPTATSISIDDLIYVVDSPGSSPVSKAVNFDYFQKSITSIGVLASDVSIPTGNYIYVGPSGSDGSWRIHVSGANLAFEKREGGEWVEKGLVTA